MADWRPRKIIHLDMDAFYASVEQRDLPELRGKPVAVGGSPDGRGVVAAASYEARKFGVHSAMSARKARQLCPQLIFVQCNFSKYHEVSRIIRGYFHEVTDLVEPLSLDEAYLDVTDNKWNEPLASRIAVRLRDRIRTELNLTASAGVAPNKFLAKLASDMRKPDGQFVIPPERISEVLEQLPVEKLWGVGPATMRKMHSLGLFTTREVRGCPPAVLEKYFGRFGVFLHALSHGEDRRLVKAHREAKSRGSETTFFEDVRDMKELSAVIHDLAADVEGSLEKMERAGHTVTLKVRYSDFSTVTRSRTGEPVRTASEIANVAVELMTVGTQAGKRAVRLLGISVKGFQADEEELQIEFPMEDIGDPAPLIPID